MSRSMFCRCGWLRRLRSWASLLGIVAFYEEAAHRLGQLPGVEWAGVTSNLAFGIFNDSHNQFRLMDRPAPSPGDYPSSSFRVVSADYFRTMAIPVLQGRVFNGEEPMLALPAHAPSMAEASTALHALPMDIVVTRSFAQHYWPGQNPVGKRLVLGTRTSRLRIARLLESWETPPRTTWARRTTRSSTRRSGSSRLSRNMRWWCARGRIRRR